MKNDDGSHRVFVFRGFTDETLVKLTSDRVVRVYVKKLEISNECQECAN